MQRSASWSDCMSCHTLERIARSSHTAEGVGGDHPGAMLRYAQNTTPLAPQMRTGEVNGAPSCSSPNACSASPNTWPR